MASHYIRAGASGADDGSSWADAWSTFAAVTFVRGDTYYVAGGTYNESRYINVNLSGSLWIYIKKANIADNGSDPGWDPSYATVVALLSFSGSGGVLDFDKGYVSIDGVTGSGTSGHGFHIYNGGTVSNCTGIFLENGKGPFSISHCNIEGSGFAAAALPTSGIYYNNGSASPKNFYLGNCWIHEVTTNGLIANDLVGTSYSDYGMTVENCVISETGGCTDADFHGQGMQLGLATDMGFIIIRNNVFRNCVGSAFIAWLGGSVTPLGSATVTVNAGAKTFTRVLGSWITDGFSVGSGLIFSGFSNPSNNNPASGLGFFITSLTATVMTCAAATGLVDEGPTVGVAFYIGSTNTDHHDVLIYNNAFYYTDPAVVYAGGVSPGVIWCEAQRNGNSGVRFRNVVVANNVCYNISQGLAQMTNEASPSDNATVLLVNNVTERSRFTTGNSGFTELTNGYQTSGTGACTGAVPSGTPGQVDGSASTFLDAMGYDFGLRSGGYAVGVGTDLSVDFTTDAAGLTRTVPWDLGAYKYTALALPGIPGTTALLA